MEAAERLMLSGRATKFGRIKKAGRAKKISAAAVLILLLAFGVYAAKGLFINDLPANCLLTADGYTITEEEFLLYLLDEKALSADYFAREYNADVSAGDDFWNAEYGGQTPLDYAKENALSKLLYAKQEQILSDERGIAAYKSFDELKAELSAENEDRAGMIESGEIFYGVADFDMMQYISYLSGARRAELTETQLAMTDMPEGEIEAEYVRGNTITVMMGAMGEEMSEQTLDSLNISKEDPESTALWEQLAASQPGETFVGVYMGEQVMAQLINGPEITPVPIEQTRENMRYREAEENLRALITRRAKETKILYNGNRFDELGW